MKSFRFFIDEKVTLWQRHKYEIVADNFEEAKSIIEKSFDDQNFTGYFEDGSEDTNYIETEELFDTLESVKLQDNQGSPTQELFYIDTESPNWQEKLIKTNLNQ